MIVATAGHVDHGKTTLVKALTGVDTDRLAEEKQRGMTIEPGFAYLDLGDGVPTAFVDVPGHERFVRNMLAGVAAIDFALLVIAADDGPMPQTLEHLAILDLLGIGHGAVALTKIDRVDSDRLRAVRDEIAVLLATGPLRGAPVFPVAAHESIGIGALRDHLAEAKKVLPPRTIQGNFRLAVDRSFTLPGAGLIVTGAVFSGAVRVGDSLLVSPAGIPVRVRGMHVHNRSADLTLAGQRCALNIVGPDLKRFAVERGDMIVAAPAHAPSARVDVQITVLAGKARSIAHWTPVHLHVGAADVNARVALLENQAAAPGASALAQLVLDRPVAVVHGDRFILRDQSAQQTIAGGVVLDPFGAVRGRARPGRLRYLKAMQHDTPATALHALLTDLEDSVATDSFAQAWNLTPDDATALFAAQALVSYQDGSRQCMLSRERWHAMRNHLLAALDEWHGLHPTGLGASEAMLAEALGARTLAPAWRAALRSLCDDGALVRQGIAYRLHDHRPRLSEEDTQMLAGVTTVLLESGLRPPVVGELAARLTLDPATLLSFLERVAHQGHLVRVARNRFFLPATLDVLFHIAVQLTAESAESEAGGFDAACYRDRSGIGRNLTIELLEFMDRMRMTRFAGGRRKAIVS